MQRASKGFTLIELLIVIAILAVLSVVVILTLNPAELLKQARDSTRASDMATLKSAIALYLSDVSSTSLGAASGGIGNCYAYSTSSAPGPAAATNCTGLGFATAGVQANVVTSTSRSTKSDGWIPANFAAISSGDPLGILPVDPINSATLFYAYRVKNDLSTYKLNSRMESLKYSNGGTGDLVSRDGGTNPTAFEVGGDLNL